MSASLSDLKHVEHMDHMQLLPVVQAPPMAGPVPSLPHCLTKAAMTCQRRTTSCRSLPTLLLCCRCF